MLLYFFSLEVAFWGNIIHVLGQSNVEDILGNQYKRVGKASSSELEPTWILNT